jgi:hypothetical protein
MTTALTPETSTRPSACLLPPHLRNHIFYADEDQPRPLAAPRADARDADCSGKQGANFTIGLVAAEVEINAKFICIFPEQSQTLAWIHHTAVTGEEVKIKRNSFLSLVNARCRLNIFTSQNS